jgi:CheY-like chemotaxis protein/nitrogen-specific signal transduction histidine kinase
MEKTQADIKLKAEELELASKYKSEFLANMSHELRTPLNSLLILAQLLGENKQNNLTDKQVEYAKTMHSAGSDLLTLINEILDLSKIEAGKIEIQIEEILLADLMATIEHKFRHVAEDKGLAFHLSIANDIPQMLQTDEQRLKQIINNLLSNAFKFTSTGEIKVMAQCPTNIPRFSALSDNVLEPTKTVAISVSDTGIGIPKDKQQVIFEAFQQVDGTTSRSYGGTGLGLSISRQLARLLNGELTLESEEGKGCTFTLFLPIGEPKHEVKPDSSVPIAQNETILPAVKKSSTTQIAPVDVKEEINPIADDRNNLQTGDKSILIVEDDRKFSNILTELAQSKGFKYLVAEDGVSGLHLAEQYQPDAIILDVGLPQLDGWSVMERLKDNPKTRHIPVHFMSAADQSMDAKKMGAIGYLLKPVTVEQIGEAFKNIDKFLTKTVKNLLIVADDEYHQHKIIELVQSKNTLIKTASTSSIACQYLQKAKYDCIILDMDIEQSSGGIKLLKQMQQKKQELCQIPVIVYADRDLSPDEEALLLRCSDELPIKSVKSPERLLDEATIFLHQIEANLPVDKRNMLRMVHDKAAILKHRKVLIVDDDIRNTYALATVLEEYDIEVLVASDGKEGLAILETNNDIAIVLMDIMMPEMDGYEAMQKIRQQPQYRNLPIIALTAKAMKGDRAKCIEAGASDYLSKPTDVNKLISLMRVWLYR